MRKVFLCDPCALYHVTSRCINREWFVSMEEAWKIFEDYCYFLHRGFNIEILSFVLMSNHYHMILRAPEGNLSEAMRYFNREVSRRLTKDSGRINQTFGTRFHRSRINSYHHTLNVYKYIYTNPVRAGICDRVEEYRYSTLSGLLGLNKLVIPIVADQILFEDSLNNNLDWLNKPMCPKYIEYVRRGLTHKEFNVALVNRRPNPLENDLL
jgi:putative transposase